MKHNLLFLVLALFSISLATGCNKHPAAATSAPASAPPAIDACTLLNAQEIEAVEGSALKDTKSSGQSHAGFQTAQCFYLTAEFNRSVSLTVTRSESGGGVDEYWHQTFGRAEKQEKEKEADKEKKESLQQQRREEGEEEGRPAKKISGIGEDAYWSGSRVGGALYVLKKNVFIRISVGGPDNEETKINKSKALAEMALSRL